MIAMPRSSVSLSVVFLGSAAALAPWWFGNPPPAVPVVLVGGSSSDGEGSIATGRVEARSGSIELSATMRGVLASIAVKAGDHVQKDQILAELVNRDAVSRVDLATAMLTMQSARLDKLKAGPGSEERGQVAAALREQDAAVARAQRDLARQKLLFSQRYSSNAALELAQNAVTAAIAKRAAMAESLGRADPDARAEAIKSAEAELTLAKAQLDEANATLDKTRIRAPLDGVVLHVYRHVGESVDVSPASAVLQIADLDNLQVRAPVAETTMAAVKQGAPVYVTSKAYPGRKFVGSVSEIGQGAGAAPGDTAAAGRQKGLASAFEVVVTLEPHAPLPMGLGVDVHLPVMRGAS